ncbi:2216_t:CDS:2, partial [Acaulospora colombiana]
GDPPIFFDCFDERQVIPAVLHQKKSSIYYGDHWLLDLPPTITDRPQISHECIAYIDAGEVAIIDLSLLINDLFIKRIEIWRTNWLMALEAFKDFNAPSTMDDYIILNFEAYNSILKPEVHLGYIKSLLPVQINNSLEDALTIIESGDQGLPLRERVTSIRNDRRLMAKLKANWIRDIKPVPTASILASDGDEESEFNTEEAIDRLPKADPRWLGDEPEDYGTLTYRGKRPDLYTHIESSDEDDYNVSPSRIRSPSRDRDAKHRAKTQKEDAQPDKFSRLRLPPDLRNSTSSLMSLRPRLGSSNREKAVSSVPGPLPTILPPSSRSFKGFWMDTIADQGIRLAGDFGESGKRTRSMPDKPKKADLTPSSSDKPARSVPDDIKGKGVAHGYELDRGARYPLDEDPWTDDELELSPTAQFFKIHEDL